MKTLDEILSRNDYVKLTPQFKDRAESIALRIRKKLVELDAEDDVFIVKGKRTCDNVEVTCRKVKTNLSSYVYLAINCPYDNENDYGFTMWCSLEDIAHSHYYDGDYSAWVRGASRKAALRFLNAAKQIIEQIGELEERKVNAVQTALEETKDL